MIRLLITFAVLFVFCRWAWKVWGKNYSEGIAKDFGEEDIKQRDSLMRKIEALKKEAEDLKDSDDEVKVSKMLLELQLQREEKEKELAELNERFIKSK